MVNWYRQLRSGQQVSYNQLPKSEVWALAQALDEWEWLLYKRFSKSGSWAFGANTEGK